MRFFLLIPCILVLSSFLGCETTGSLSLNTPDDMYISIEGDYQTIQYGIYTYERTRIQTPYVSASDSFTKDMNQKADNVVMDKEIAIPGKLFFRRNPSLNYIYRFNNLNVVGKLHFRVYKNSSLVREFDFDKRNPLGPAVVDFR